MGNSIYSTGNAIVDENAKLNITGNIIPQAWYRTVIRDSGKPNLTAIVILADICYWYKPTELRDESTGQVTAVKKKFKSDLLQRSYQQISEQFGISKKEATNAIIFLEKLGVIKRLFRTVTINGLVVNNVLYLELIVSKLREITYPGDKTENPLPIERDREKAEKQETSAEYDENGQVSTLNEGAVSFERGRVSLSEGTPASPESREESPIEERHYSSAVETNTEITTQIINRDYTNPIISYQATELMFKHQIDYDAIWIDRPHERDQLNEIVAIAVDVLTSGAKTIRINREDRPVEIVQSVYRKLQKGSVELVMDSIRKCKSKATNIRAVIMTALYNATMTSNSYYNNLFAYNEGIPQT